MDRGELGHRPPQGNYFIDLSGWAPKYFPAELLHNINTLLQDKAMFGSDWPAIGVERWLEEFQQVNMKPEVRKKIMLDNAVKVFRHNAVGTNWSDGVLEVLE